jgi:hypothetical protein
MAFLIMTDKEYSICTEHTELVREFTMEYFNSVKAKRKFKIYKPRIVPSMYKRALDDFMLFGKVTRFPEKIILGWRESIVNNIALLEAMTAIGGHTSYFPFEEFNDAFFYDPEVGDVTRETYDYTEAVKILEEYDLEDKNFPLWSNGQWLLSDFALEPLLMLSYELSVIQDVSEMLTCMDRIMNVVHERSDIAELFMVGGSKSLTVISN